MDDPQPASIHDEAAEIIRRRVDRDAKKLRKEKIAAAAGRVETITAQVHSAAKRHRAAAKRLFRVEDKLRRAIRRLSDLSSEEGSLIV